MATGALTSGLHQGRALAVDLDPRPPGLKNEGRHDQGRAQHDGDEDTPKRHGPLLINHPELGVRKDFAVWRVGRPGSLRSFATLGTQSLEKPNVTHLQRLAKSRVRVHQVISRRLVRRLSQSPKEVRQLARILVGDYRAGINSG